MSIHFSLSEMCIEFNYREIGADELEEIIIEAIERECPGSHVEDIQYTDNGVDVIIKDGETISIDIDWEEIIITT